VILNTLQANRGDMFGIHVMDIVGWKVCYSLVVISILRIEESSSKFVSPVIGEKRKLFADVEILWYSVGKECFMPCLTCIQ